MTNPKGFGAFWVLTHVHEELIPYLKNFVFLALSLTSFCFFQTVAISNKFIHLHKFKEEEEEEEEEEDEEDEKEQEEGDQMYMQTTQHAICYHCNQSHHHHNHHHHHHHHLDEHCLQGDEDK